MNYSTDVCCAAQRGRNTDILKCHPSPCWESGQRIVSLHSRLCSEEGESTGLLEALVVCGCLCFGRRMEGDELKAPQL